MITSVPTLSSELGPEQTGATAGSAVPRPPQAVLSGCHIVVGARLMDTTMSPGESVSPRTKALGRNSLRSLSNSKCAVGEAVCCYTNITCPSCSSMAGGWAGGSGTLRGVLEPRRSDPGCGQVSSAGQALGASCGMSRGAQERPDCPPWRQRSNKKCVSTQ